MPLRARSIWWRADCPVLVSESRAWRMRSPTACVVSEIFDLVELAMPEALSLMLLASPEALSRISPARSPRLGPDDEYEYRAGGFLPEAISQASPMPTRAIGMGLFFAWVPRFWTNSWPPLLRRYSTPWSKSCPGVRRCSIAV